MLKHVLATAVSEVFDVAMHDSFVKLTGGKAQYGQPGVGCTGPYELLRVTIERVDGTAKGEDDGRHDV